MMNLKESVTKHPYILSSTTFVLGALVSGGITYYSAIETNKQNALYNVLQSKISEIKESTVDVEKLFSEYNLKIIKDQKFDKKMQEQLLGRTIEMYLALDSQNLKLKEGDKKYITAYKKDIEEFHANIRKVSDFYDLKPAFQSMQKIQKKKKHIYLLLQETLE